MLRRLVTLGLILAALMPGPPVVAQSPILNRPLHLDNSDWWSVGKDDDSDDLKPQSRQLSLSNFRVSGISIWNHRAIVEKFGQVRETIRGDAGTYRRQSCYVSPDRKFHFIVEYGEVNAAYYFFDRGPDWNGSAYCTVSPLLSRQNFSTDSGLRLGMTPAQLRAVLGEPSAFSRSDMQHFVGFKKPTPPGDLKRWREQHPEMTDEEFYENYAELDVTYYVLARFSDGRLSYLAVSRAETY